MLDNVHITRCFAVASSIMLHAGLAVAWIAWPRSLLTVPLQQVMAVNLVMLPSLEQAQDKEQSQSKTIQSPSERRPLPVKEPSKNQVHPAPLEKETTRQIQSLSIKMPEEAQQPLDFQSSKLIDTTATIKPETDRDFLQNLPASYNKKETLNSGVESEAIIDGDATLQENDNRQLPSAAEKTDTATKPIFNAASLKNVPPTYPEEARRNGKEGRVILNVDVTPEGTALGVRIKRSSGYRILDYAARDAVQRWRFIPAQRGLITVSASILVPVEFQLKQ